MNRKTLTATRARINRQIERRNLRMAELAKSLRATNEIITANNEDWPQSNDVARALISGPQMALFSLQRALHSQAVDDLSNAYLALTHVNDEIAALGPVTRVKRQPTPAAAQLALL